MSLRTGSISASISHNAGVTREKCVCRERRQDSRALAGQRQNATAYQPKATNKTALGTRDKNATRLDTPQHHARARAHHRHSDTKAQPLSARTSPRGTHPTPTHRRVRAPTCAHDSTVRHCKAARGAAECGTTATKNSPICEPPITARNARLQPTPAPAGKTARGAAPTNPAECTLAVSGGIAALQWSRAVLH
eukprot:4989529-Prymnesium_polylepis.1